MKKPLILALLILLAVPSSPSSAGNLVKYKGQKAGQYCKNLEVGAKVNLPTGQKLICARSSASAKPKWSKVAIQNNVTPKPSSSSPAPSESPKPISEPSPTPTPVNNQPAFTLSSSSETRTVNTAATGFTINSTGGAIASFAINATPPGMSFSTSTGALTGTPTSVAGATAYTITAKNATGSATATFTLTVTGTTCDGSFTCQVGDTGPGGGVVYYINLSGFSEAGAPCGSSCHYLEAAPANWHSGGERGITWSTGSNQSAMTGALGTVIGTGYQNSLDIVAQTGNLAASSAAVAARAYTGGSKNDWFLPSKDELAQLYAQKTIVGGFVGDGYWSSTEFDSTDAWYQLSSGVFQSNYGDKGDTGYVRPVRAF